MWRRLIRFNTLRNQILFGFLLAMIMILFVVGIVTFGSLSKLLRSNAESHIQQTAVQANGRLEAVLNQIDTLMTEVATNSYIQDVLTREWMGQPVTFAEKQSLQTSLNLLQTYSSGVYSAELYSVYSRRLFPLDGGRLNERINEDWISKARDNKGIVVWIGIDPADPERVLAVRSITLMDHWFATGGYLLVRMDRKMFDIGVPLTGEGSKETMLIAGGDGSLIASNDSRFGADRILSLLQADSNTVTAGTEQYILVKKKSELTGWTLLILTPISAVTKGISVLRTAIVVSGAIGTLLFMILSFFLSTLITRPILRLIKTMRSARFGGLKPADHSSSTMEINELNHTYNQMVAHMNELIKLVYEKETLRSRTELKALQAQIHPHFLFNTLEALYWSLQERDEEELAEYVVAMSDLFRYTITAPNRDEWVTLRQELEHIERYLLVMKLRFGDRLSWSIETQPAFANVRLPKLLIQPLVENAILHGVESRIGPGSVTIHVQLEESGERLVIGIKDDGKGMDPRKLQGVLDTLQSGKESTSKGLGVGLSNVLQRVQLYFGGPEQGGELTIHSEVGQGTEVRLYIPIKTGVEEG